MVERVRSDEHGRCHAAEELFNKVIPESLTLLNCLANLISFGTYGCFRLLKGTC